MPRTGRVCTHAPPALPCSPCAFALAEVHVVGPSVGEHSIPQLHHFLQPFAMGNITSCCESCRQFSPYASSIRSPTFDVHFCFQLGPESLTRMNLCCWKTSGRPWQTFRGSSKVRKFHLLDIVFDMLLTIDPRPHEYQLLLGHSTGSVDNTLVFRQCRPPTKGRYRAR